MSKPQKINTNQSILFSGASLDDLAKTYLSQDGELGLRAREAVYGLKCSELLRKLDPVLYLLRTSVEQSISPSIPSEWDWRSGVTASGLSSFQLLRLEPLTEESASSSSGYGKVWPTPTTMDVSTDKMKSTQVKVGSMHSVTLSMAVKLWPTPVKSDNNGAASLESMEKRRKNPLSNSLRDAVSAQCGPRRRPVETTTEPERAPTAETGSRRR